MRREEVIFFTPCTVGGNFQHTPIFSNSPLTLHVGQSLGSSETGQGIVGVLISIHLFYNLSVLCPSKTATFTRSQLRHTDRRLNTGFSQVLNSTYQKKNTSSQMQTMFNSVPKPSINAPKVLNVHRTTNYPPIPFTNPELCIIAHVLPPTQFHNIVAITQYNRNQHHPKMDWLCLRNSSSI